MTLIDTNIFIEVFKGNSEALQKLESVGAPSIALSSVTAMELYVGAFNKLELQRIKKHLCSFQILHISREVSESATKLVALYAKSHGLQIPDAIIAATALEYAIPMMTLNTKDFRFIAGLQLV